MKNKKSSTSKSLQQKGVHPEAVRWIIIPMLVLLLLWIVGMFFPEERTWGFHHTAYTPLMLNLFLVTLALISLSPSVTEYIARGFQIFTNRIAVLSRLQKIISLWICSVSGGILFYFFAIPTSFLGDSYLYIAEIVRTIDGQPVDFFKYDSLLTSFIFLYLGSKLILYFHISEIVKIFYYFISIFGGVFIIVLVSGIAKITKDIWNAFLLFGLFLGLGGIIFFFGYVEYYAPLFVCSTGYVLSLYRAVDRSERLIIPAIFLILSILFHFLAVFFLPSFITVLVQRYKTRKGQELTSKQFLWLAFSGVAIFIILCGIIILFQIKPLYGSLIPFQKQSWTGTYLFFSSYHLIDILNELFLTSAIPFLFLISLTVTFRKHLSLANKNTQVFLVFAVSLLLLTIVHFPFYGMARDWDIYAPLGTSIACLSYALFNSLQLTEHVRRYVSSVIFVWSCVSLVLWMYVNIHEPSALARYKNILQLDEQHVYPDFAQYGYLNLSKYYERHNDYLNQTHALLRMIELRSYPWDISKFISVVNSIPDPEVVRMDIDAMVGLLEKKSTDSLLMSVMQDHQQTDSSEYVVDQLFRLNPKIISLIFSEERIQSLIERNPSLVQYSFFLCSYRMNIMNKTIDFSEYFDRFEKNKTKRLFDKPIFSKYLNTFVYYDAGHQYMKRQRYDSAIVWYKKYYTLDSTNGLLLNNYGYALSRQGNHEQALPLFYKAISIDSTYAMPYYNLALYYIQVVPDYVKAISFLKKYISNEKNHDAQESAMYLLKQIESRNK